ncbi:MAG: hypothetical protein AAF657_27975 [Acidobacteriota bacterium]
MYSQHTSTQNPSSAQDLSGDKIKVVQYYIVSVVPGIADNARVLAGPEVVAFGDDMTSEDFTAWIIAENSPPYLEDDEPCYPPGKVSRCWDRKYLRVAFSVMGRFSKAKIDWKELQALSVAKIAEKLPCEDQEPAGSQRPKSKKRTAAAAAAAAAAADS